MKSMKKIATFILAVCLMVPCFSMLTHAANDGEIMFSDHVNPAVQTGTTVEVKGVVKRLKGNFGKIEITMTYDTSLLKFQSGDGVTETAAGTLQYSGDATSENGSRKEFLMKFQAIKAGTSTITISDAAVKNVSGTVLDYKKGTSTIKTIGDPVESTTAPSTSSDVTVEIDGKNYKFADAVPTKEIPEGYVAAKLEYDLVEYNSVYSEALNLHLVYLVDEENTGGIFMYVEETATFAPYEAIQISDKTTIVLLSDTSAIVLPEEYKLTQVVTTSGKTFPAWQNENTPEFCIFYAMNNSGEKALYQMDPAEGTYQRFQAPEVVEEEKDTSILGRVSAMLENHLDYVILGAGFGFLLFVIVIVVLSIKLYNRNAELDEIYDEYGIDANNEVQDDLILDLDNFDDDSEEEDEEEFAQPIPEESPFLQEGMKELFPEELEEESMDEVADNLSEESEENNEEEEEDTLGSILAQQQSADESDEEDDEEDFLENFSIDFIDLDD